ncbi:MAG TPA: SHOCT domain-containing protein [Flavobacterium sp.]|uniref:SHOCT domain-containing protein n=1 Tax=Flavobacterium sp. TaxID=239 RepID=UPI002F3FB1A1
MMYHDNYWNMGMMWIIWLPIMVFCFIFLYRFFDNTNKNRYSEKESPIDILKRRYANGELTTAEYEERKKALGSS